MTRKKPLSSPFVVTVSVAAAATFSVACGGKTSGVDPGPGITNPPSISSCTPSTKAGDSCNAQESNCTPGGADEGDPIALTCVNGVWVFPNGPITEPPYPPICPPQDLRCPDVIPVSGTSCVSTSCGDLYPAHCTYPQGNDCPPPEAFCDAKTLRWVVSISTCNPPPPDAGAGDQ